MDTSDFLLLFLKVIVGVQFLYFFYFYSSILFYKAPLSKEVNLPVSIIVCAHNEKENLLRLIPMLLNQDYLQFEVLLVDDRSNDGSKELLGEILKAHTNFRIIQIEDTPAGLNSKKFALAQGIKAAKHDWVLLTDADCMPTSRLWIKSMVSVLGDGKKIVLGYSPYELRPGFLNKLIQLDTFYTAFNYFSFAIRGIPYMGVGRNILYDRRLFFENKGFSTHETVTGGDDDLLMRDIAKGQNVVCCLIPEGFVISRPKENFKEWIIQKRRHMSVGVHYHLRHKLLLGILQLSYVLFYIFLGIGLFFLAKSTLQVFMIRSLVFVLIFVLIASKLKGNSQWIWLLLVIDIVFIFNYVLLSASLLYNKRVKWN